MDPQTLVNSTTTGSLIILILKLRALLMTPRPLGTKPTKVTRWSVISKVSNPTFSPESHCLFMAIGYDHLKTRFEIFKKCKELGYEFPNLVHKTCVHEEDLKMGEGNLLLSGAVLDQSVTLGNLNVVDIGVLIGHNSEISDNNYISNGTLLSGYCFIGNHNFVGGHTSFVDHVKIGDHNFLNARSYIRKDLGDHKKVIPMITQKEFKN